MRLIARTPIDVMLGEMAYGVSDATRYADLQAIASVISNRATALGVTPQQVVAKQSEFNAYGKGLPPGASAYRDLAEAAWNDIAVNGPTHTGTFYATPSAVGNLPKGLRQVTEVDGGHRYFEDPHGRAIKTSVGYRAPVDLAATRAAVAQRIAFEQATVNDEEFATPQERPQVMPITQNPALLADMPLSQFDPNISTGVPDVSALTGMPNAALAQQMQASAPAATQQDLDAAASRFGEDPGAMISSPADLAAALSRMNVPAANTFDISQAMNDAIAASIDASAASKTGRIGTTVDPARMADNAPMSEADKALQGMMKEAAASTMSDRFAGPARPITQTVSTTSIPGQAPSGSYIPGTAPIMDVSGVPANRVQSIAVKPGDEIDSPEALAAALGSFPTAMAAQREVTAPTMTEAATLKSDRVGGIDTSAMDTSRLGPDAIQTADAALKDAINRATASSARPADISAFSDAMAAQRGQPFSMTNNQAQAAIDAAAVAQTPSNAVAAKTDRLTPSDPKQDALAAAAVNPSLMAADSLTDASPALRTSPPTNVLTVDNQIRQNGLVQDLSLFDDALPGVKPAATPTVPALETVEIAKQPAIKPATVDQATVTPAVTAAVPAATKSMPAVQQREATAMDVWKGSAQTGIATDGSTVSRLSSDRIGRYDPKFDQTTFTSNMGQTWSSPVKGNQLSPASSPLASVQPAVSQSLISRLVSALTGITGASPADVGPPMGLDGGMTIAHDGAAGAPGGWGRGGSMSNPGSAGGYGSTGGRDPNGAR